MNVLQGPNGSAPDGALILRGEVDTTPIPKLKAICDWQPLTNEKKIDFSYVVFLDYKFLKAGIGQDTQTNEQKTNKPKTISGSLVVLCLIILCWGILF